MKIPRDVSGAELVQSLGTFGYTKVRQTGSHIQLVSTLKGEHHLTIPLHSPVKIGTLNAILKLVAEHFKISKQEVLEKINV